MVAVALSAGIQTLIAAAGSVSAIGVHQGLCLMTPLIWGGRNDRRDTELADRAGEAGRGQEPEITLDFCMWLQNKGFDEIIEELNGIRHK